jgi:hypothetical protein
MTLHIFFVMSCALVFYFAYSYRSKFKPILNLNEFAIYKKRFENLKQNSYFPKSLWAEALAGPALFSFLFSFTPRGPDAGPTWPALLLSCQCQPEGET